MAEFTSNPPKRSRDWQKMLAFGSFAILCAVCTMTLVLIGFRIVHFRSTDYGLLLTGFRIGWAVRILLLPAAVVQAGGIVAGVLEIKKYALARLGAIGGVVALVFLIGVLWVNLSEILIGDFHPAVQTRMAEISDALIRQYDPNTGFPEALDRIGENTGHSGFLSDPYDSDHRVFGYHATVKGFILLSSGPDGSRELLAEATLASMPAEIQKTITQRLYDSTNGTWSKGDLVLWTDFPK